MQLGLLGGDQNKMLGAGGLQIIQDDNEDNQDSDFSGDEEDKIVLPMPPPTGPENGGTNDANNIVNEDPLLDLGQNPDEALSKEKLDTALKKGNSVTEDPSKDKKKKTKENVKKKKVKWVLKLIIIIKTLN